MSAAPWLRGGNLKSGKSSKVDLPFADVGVQSCWAFMIGLKALCQSFGVGKNWIPTTGEPKQNSRKQNFGLLYGLDLGFYVSISFFENVVSAEAF